MASQPAFPRPEPAAALLERDVPLRTLRQLLYDASRQGHVALVAGEAGIGKTSLLRALAADYAPAGPTWWGACDALQTPHPLAPLQDIAREAAVRFAPRLNGPRPALFEAVLDELRHAAVPVLMVIEDAHWADDATLDLLKFLGRRIEHLHVVLAVTFRDDELTGAHPLRRLLGELPIGSRTRIDLQRLTPQAVDLMARDAGRSSEGVHAITRGNAFFVTEVLRETGNAVPATVQDAVLARAARLPDAARGILELASIVPGHCERWLIDELLAPRLADLEACLGSGLLQAEDGHLVFRHELGRAAIEGSLSGPVAQALHARTLGALAAPQRRTPPARLVHHALRAGDREAVSRHAPLAADEARLRGAHREEAAQWRHALHEGTPPEYAALERWLDAYATACGFGADSEAILWALKRLERMARDRGDLVAAAVRRSRQTGALIALLRNDEAEAASREALALIEPLPESIAHFEVWLDQGFLRMLDRDCEESVQWGRRSLALAERLGERRLVLRARNALGVPLLFIDYDAGCALLEDTVDAYRAQGSVADAAGILLNLGSGSGELMRLPQAERHLREALAISRPNELDHHTNYCEAWLAIVALLRGRWDEAATLATAVLARTEPDISHIMALVALARLRLRRGDPGLDELLERAVALAGRSRTLQRIGAARGVRAEAAFARGDRAGAAHEVEQALALARAKRHPWFIGELAYWGWRAGVVARPPEHCADPYALEMTGRWREAAAAWQVLDCPYERARALAEGDEAAQREALATFDALGARPAADALRRRLREAGIRGVSRGARASTRSHPCDLTNAEMKVLALLAEDLRNADIAVRLHRSVRTVDHHVAAVLAKLGARSRQQAVQRARREGWLPGG